MMKKFKIAIFVSMLALSAFSFADVCEDLENRITLELSEKNYDNVVTLSTIFKNLGC